MLNHECESRITFPLFLTLRDGTFYEIFSIRYTVIGGFLTAAVRRFVSPPDTVYLFVLLLMFNVYSNSNSNGRICSAPPTVSLKVHYMVSTPCETEKFTVSDLTLGLLVRVKFKVDQSSIVRLCNRF